ncbi:hypothetical protein ACOSQ4_016301 [Xanthoceras sorbifolium]
MESSPTINIARVSSENSSTKRCRGQPKGSGKLQNLASLATGTVSSVVLCQSGYVANGLKFVGQFEILHLSGSFTHTEVGGKNRRIGKLSISLSKPDGQVFGGVVVGPLIAATPIQSYSFHDFIFFMSLINNTSLSFPVLTNLQIFTKSKEK